MNGGIAHLLLANPIFDFCRSLIHLVQISVVDQHGSAFVTGNKLNSRRHVSLDSKNEEMHEQVVEVIKDV